MCIWYREYAQNVYKQHTDTQQIHQKRFLLLPYFIGIEKSWNPQSAPYEININRKKKQNQTK